LNAAQVRLVLVPEEALADTTDAISKPGISLLPREGLEAGNPHEAIP